MKFSVYAPYRGITGYDYVVRSFLKEWYNQGHDVALSEFARWSNRRGGTDIEHIITEFEANNSKITPEFHINFCLLDQAKLNLNVPNFIYTMFESDRICQGWVESAKKLDGIIVPTKFSQDVFVKSGIPSDKVVVCPVPLDINIIRNKPSNIELADFEGNDLRKYKHRFLNVSEYITRKNVDGLIQSWCDETKETDEACLILKLASNSGLKTDFFQQKLDKIVKKKNCAPIFVYFEHLDENKMLALYRYCTHYITASYGEGWGVSESICGVLGKKLIAPNSTAFTAYLKDDPKKPNEANSYLIGTQSIGAHQEGPTEAYYLGSAWYAPVHFYIRKCIRKSITEANANDNVKNLRLANEMAANFESGKVANELIVATQTINPIKQTLPSTLNEKKSDFNFMVICKSLGAKCGISDYSKMLYNSCLLESNRPLFGGSMMVKGESVDYRSQIDQNNLHIVNLQLEYQFISPIRLKGLLTYLNNSKIVPVVTLHTVNPRAYDYHEVLINGNARIIVSSELMKTTLVTRCGFNADNVKVVPMGITNELLAQPEPKPEGSKFRIGFFGFCYFHKGIDKLTQYMATHGMDKECLIFSSKPENDTGYFDKIFNQVANTNAPIQWVHNYLDEAQIINGLSTCDLIVLPYSEYGGVGVSAAIRTAIKAGVPIATFQNSFFQDCVADAGLIKFIGNNPVNFNEWSANLNNYIEYLKTDKAYKGNYLKLRNKFVEDYNWDKVSQIYLNTLQEFVKTGV